jgi:hypothetical protein
MSRCLRGHNLWAKKTETGAQPNKKGEKSPIKKVASYCYLCYLILCCVYVNCFGSARVVCFFQCAQSQSALALANNTNSVVIISVYRTATTQCHSSYLYKLPDDHPSQRHDLTENQLNAYPLLHV